MRRVVVTGMGGVTSLGQNWETVKAGLLAHRNAVRRSSKALRGSMRPLS